MDLRDVYKGLPEISTQQKDLVEKLKKSAEEEEISMEEVIRLLVEPEYDATYLHQAADEVRRAHYGREVYTRGLIEFSNFCRNNCLYCGIRRDNRKVERYRLSCEEIVSCADEGYGLGFRTIVLQGGEDGSYSDEDFCRIISGIREHHPDCAVTLSLGERSYESYKKLFQEGADRYLLRHETADKAHYEYLHPAEMSFEHRRESLYQLKEIGYQVGAGMMLGSPGQTPEYLAKDLAFLKELSPDMIGMGPFVPHKDTPFGKEQQGGLTLTLKMLSVIRLLFPYVLLPATTALGTIHPLGREYGLMSGANVVMPNLSPTEVRKLYSLYNNKICTGEESAQCVGCLDLRVKETGYELVSRRGDVRR